MTQFGDIPSPSRPGPKLRWLIVAAIATVVLWQVPFGNYILYPFTILATWFHEMGHGLMAVLLGGSFKRLVIFPNGSGLAIHTNVRLLGPIGDALVSAAGPMGPAIAGAALILASRSKSSTRLGLLILGGVLLFSTVVWVRSLTGWLVLPLLGVAIIFATLAEKPWLQAFTIQFLGVQACISVYRQLGYLFTYQVNIGGRGMLSDTGQMSRALLLPHWVWGSILAIAAAYLLIASLQIAYRQ